MLRTTLITCALALSSVLVGCDDDGPVIPDTPEPTLFTVQVENVSEAYPFIGSGGFMIPDGASMPGPATPGNAYSFRFRAGPGQRLNFATMFVQSNDLFYAPAVEGIALFENDGTPRSGDITSELLLWDAGTEVNQEPGVGSDQAPRQGGPDQGAPDANSSVRVADDAFGNLPDNSDVIHATLTYLGDAEFMVRIGSLADATISTSEGMVPMVLSPGVWAVGSGDISLFTVGSPDRGEGLEAIAEDGANQTLVASLAGRTGVTSPLAPGVFAVHGPTDLLFASGMPDRGQGLEALAEDGVPTELAASVDNAATVTASGAFDTPDGASGPAPIFPGESYSFEVEASPGEHLSLATMFVQSNDLFFAPAVRGMPLFSGDTPRSGDVTGEFLLWDSGTEMNQAPGIGADQAPRQSGPDVGADENGVVRPVNDGYLYPSVGAVLRVTITPQS